MSFERPPSNHTPDRELSELRTRVVQYPELVPKLLRLLERKGMAGAIVPVEVPQGDSAEPQPAEQRWVEWKRAYNKDGQEIPGHIEKIFRVELRNAPLEELIEDGHYDYVDPNITSESFPLEQSEGRMDFPLIQFNRMVDTEEVNAWLEQNELRGATLKELLVVGSEFPQEHRRIFVAGLGQQWQGTEDNLAFVPILLGNAQTHSLNLYEGRERWHDFDHFLAVSKPVIDE